LIGSFEYKNCILMRIYKNSHQSSRFPPKHHRTILRITCPNVTFHLCIKKGYFYRNMQLRRNQIQPGRVCKIYFAHAESFNQPKPAFPANTRKSAYFRESIREIFQISIAKGWPKKVHFCPFFSCLLFGNLLKYLYVCKKVNINRQ